MTGTDSLLSLLTGGGTPTPVSTANPQSAEWTANPPAPAPQPDPWTTDQGKEAMAAWGINTDTTPDTTEPPAAAPDTTESQPVTPATPIMPNPVAQSAQETAASAPAHGPYRFEQHHPYDPTWLGADRKSVV